MLQCSKLQCLLLLKQCTCTRPNESLPQLNYTKYCNYCCLLLGSMRAITIYYMSHFLLSTKVELVAWTL